MKSHPLYPYLAAVLSMLLWGMSFVWTAVLLEYYAPVTIIFLRLSISTLFMFIILKITGSFQQIKPRDYRLFLLSALFNPFFYFLGENYGVKLTTPTISAVLIATIPLFAPIAAWIVLKERLSRLNIIGFVISFAGILIMLLNRDLHFESSPLGSAALMFAVFSAVIYSIMLKKLSDRYAPFFIIAVQNLLGMIYFLPLFLIFEFQHFISIAPTIEVISSFFALAILCSSLAFVFFTIAMREIGVAKANVFTNLIPVFTGIFSYFVIDERLGKQKIFGIIIVVAGLFFAQLGRYRSLKKLK
ncbi:MAG: DMT family transporter [Bacteroidetes bacterium]|nr:DMT family transporter [Bacteroidota bacterium]